MKRSSLLSGCLMILVAFNLSACGRASIAAVNREQNTYYSQLSKVLADQNDLFSMAIDTQLQADEARRRQVLEWKRDLAKADVLLQSGNNPVGKQELLFRKTAELDIASQQEFARLDEAERARGQALKGLYSALVKATLAAQKNNAQITNYLESGSASFAAHSIDAGGAALAISTIQARLEQLKGATEETTAERKAASEKLQKQVEDAQNLLVKGLERQNGQPH